MIYLKRFLLKDFVVFFVLALSIACSSSSQGINTKSNELISIQENFRIEGKFKVSNMDSKETGYFVIDKKTKTISLTLGKNYLLPERNFIFDVRENINIKEFIDDEVTDLSLPEIKLMSLLELFIGLKSNEFEKENITVYMDFKELSSNPSKISMSREDFELTLLINTLWKN
tara:strand:+ start:1269 stop:1784 length:516 start_codon:yes stop_codon:yes gene_type:complete